MDWKHTLKKMISEAGSRENSNLLLPLINDHMTQDQAKAMVQVINAQRAEAGAMARRAAEKQRARDPMHPRFSRGN